MARSTAARRPEIPVLTCLVVGQVATGWFLVPGEHSDPDIAKVAQPVHAGQPRGLPGIGIMMRARYRRTDRDEVPPA